jgi:HYR domain/Galactose oxidase, central domain
MITTSQKNQSGRQFIAFLTTGVTLAVATLVTASTSKQVEELTNPLVVPRTGHAATVLSDGRVFITGGHDSAGNIVAVSEIFDPATETSTGSATLTTPRVNHTATLLADGKVLVAGGTGASGAVNSAEIFDPANASAGFRTLSATMGAARERHTATLLSNSTVLIAGGDTGGTAEIFDPTTETFSSALLTLATPRTGHTATLFSNDNVLLAGGGTNSMEMFTSADKKFTIDPKQMSASRTGHFALELSDTRLLLFGGDTNNTIDEFNLSTDTVTLKGSLDAAASSATLLANGNILVIRPDSAGLYSPDSAAFTAFDETSVPGSTALLRSGQTATQLKGDKKIFVAGGRNAQNLFQGAALFNPVRIWTDKDDYVPGDNVILSGSGWKPNENVYLYAVDDTSQAWTYGSTVTTDANGGFVVDPYFVVQLVQLGANFSVSAVGAQSAMQADVQFTDSVVSVTIDTVNGIPKANFGPPTNTHITYTSLPQFVTVAFTYATSAAGSTTAELELVGAIPAVTTGQQPKASSPTDGALISGSLTLTIPSSTPNNLTGYNLKVTVRNSAGSGANNKNDQASQAIIINVPSNHPPVAVCKNVTASAGANCQATVAASAFDGGSSDPDAGDAISFSASPAGPYGIGVTNVILTVTDNHGASSTCNATVTVKDDTKPVITGCPTDITVYTGRRTTCDAVATWTAPTASDNCHLASFTSDRNSGDTFPVGQTTVTYTAKDDAGNTSTCSFKVTVVDNTKPVPDAASLPDVIAQCSANLPAAPTATDNCDGVISGTPSNPGPFGQGDYIITWTFKDNAGNSSTQNQAIHVHDTIAPVPNASSLPDVNEQCSANLPAAPAATDNCDGAIIGTTTSTGPFGQGDFTIVWTFSDSHGNSSTQNQAVHVHDTTPPTISCPGDQIVNADPLVCSAKVSGIAPTSGDNCGSPTVTYTLTGDPTGSGNGDASGTAFNVGTTTVTYTATDVGGNTASCSFDVTVNNPNPVVTMTGPPNGSLYAINTPVNFTGTFTDAGGGTHTGTWMFDSISKAATIVEPSMSNGYVGSANATYTFTAAGVYTVKLTLNDSCGGSGTAALKDGVEFLVIVYDPSAGFVTGGGWINSPPNAYLPDLTLTGKATFGFVSKYLKGANKPTGETEFQFQVANFNFHSSVYEWLVVSGPLAQYKGSGTINGSGDYGFLLTATDGQVSGGGGVDKFRIKIWDKTTSAVIYDNARGSSDDINTANPQAIGGGSIVIHK